MVRGAIIGAALLTLLAGATSAQESTVRVVFINTERTEWTFRWVPATGPVYGYECCIEYPTRDIRHCAGSADTEHTFTPDWWWTWRIQVRAMDEFISYGHWSDYSYLFNINPNLADSDYDGGVGITDLGILTDEWGEVAGERDAE